MKSIHNFIVKHPGYVSKVLDNFGVNKEEFLKLNEINQSQINTISELR